MLNRDSPRGPNRPARTAPTASQDVGSFRPTLRVSVVLPNGKVPLDLLRTQSYPSRLIDAAAVADLRAARNDVVLWLPGLSTQQELPRQLVEAHARWHHGAHNVAVTRIDVGEADAAAPTPSFESTIPHNWRNPGAAPARGLWINSPVSF